MRSSTPLWSAGHWTRSWRWRSPLTPRNPSSSRLRSRGRLSFCDRGSRGSGAPSALRASRPIPFAVDSSGWSRSAVSATRTFPRGSSPRSSSWERTRSATTSRPLFAPESRVGSSSPARCVLGGIGSTSSRDRRMSSGSHFRRTRSPSASRTKPRASPSVETNRRGERSFSRTSRSRASRRSRGSRVSASESGQTRSWVTHC